MRPRSHFSFPPFLRRRNRFIPIGCLTELGKTMGAFRVSDGLAGYNGVSLKQFTPDPNAAAVPTPRVNAGASRGTESS